MAMISIEGRPKKWEEMAGQDICKSLLKAIIKDPDNSPHCILVYGSYGSGKTTSARIFAAELNHIPYDDLTTTPFLQELDSSQLNKDTINRLIESWYSVPTGGYRVIVLDEVHLLTAAVQSALLKVFEDVPPRTFFFMATTDVEKIMDTIRSRSLEIKITPVPDDLMKENLAKMAERFNITVDNPAVYDRIVQIGKGHPRTCHMELSKYQMLGEDAYLSLFKSAYSEISRFFWCAFKKDKDNACKAIDSIMTFPLYVVKDDFYKVLFDLTKAWAGFGDAKSQALQNLIGNNTLSVIKNCQAEWVKSSFDSDTELQAMLLCLLQMFCASGSSSAPTQRAAAPVVSPRGPRG